MRHMNAAAVLACTLFASPLLAQAGDPHAEHHPASTTPAPEAKPTPSPAPSGKACPMMEGMKGDMAGCSEQDMKVMQEMMNRCMAAKGGQAGDQHQH